MDIYSNFSALLAIIGALAFVISVITELTKGIGFLDKIPTTLQVIILSLVLCPTTLFALAAYYNIVIEWFMVFASFIAAFIVAFVSMFGWEKLTDIWTRFKTTS